MKNSKASNKKAKKSERALSPILRQQRPVAQLTPYTFTSHTTQIKVPRSPTFP